MIPPTKIISLGIRLFTRPLSVFVKAAYKASDTKPFIPRRLIAFGHRFNRLEMEFRNRLLNKRGNYKGIADDKALEIGVEYLCEGLIYSILFVWGIFEYSLYKSQAEVIDSRSKESISAIILKIEILDKAFEDIHSKCKGED